VNEQRQHLIPALPSAQENEGSLPDERKDKSRMGHRITRASSHLSADSVKKRMNTDGRAFVRRHWWIIYNALVAPRKAEEIALHTGVSARTVHRVIAIYNRLGPIAKETSGKGGRVPGTHRLIRRPRSNSISRAKRCWAPPGMRPHVPAQAVREYIYVYTAVAPALGQMVSLLLPEASTEMMNLFLEQVSQTFSKHFIVMQVDGAGWQRANDLVIPENIRLISQPAYSPELNPVEHIWDDLREKYFHNRIFSSLELLIDVLCQGLTALADDAERLRSLTGFPHLKVTI
jgi:DDE superfamily endonuclease